MTIQGVDDKQMNKQFDVRESSTHVFGNNICSYMHKHGLTKSKLWDFDT